MEAISCRGSGLRPHEARVLVDKVVGAGVDRRSLYWVMGRMARRSVQRYMEFVGGNEEIRRDAVFGGGEDVGMFIGVPYVVDAGIPDGQIWLRRVLDWESVGSLVDLGVEAIQA